MQVSPAELAGVTGWFADLDKAQARSNRRALLKGGKKAASLSVKEIAARIGVKQKIIRRRLKAFPAPVQFRGRQDFIRVWLGLRAVILPKHDRRILKGWRGTFEAKTKSGHVGVFARRPNPLRLGGTSSHKNPSPAGKPNPSRHSLPIDEAKEVLDRKQTEPIVFRHAQHAAVIVYPAEFRRLLERDAARLAKK